MYSIQYHMNNLRTLLAERESIIKAVDCKQQWSELVHYQHQQLLKVETKIKQTRMKVLNLSLKPGNERYFSKYCVSLMSD